MNNGHEAIEANANILLWCVTVAGPDEVHAASSHADAVDRAAKMNRALHVDCAGMLPKTAQPILCFAYPAPWPWSPESHAKDLASVDIK